MEINMSRTADFSGLRKANSERRVANRSDAQSANRKDMPFLRPRDGSRPADFFDLSCERGADSATC